jgi:hypothetical protein
MDGQLSFATLWAARVREELSGDRLQPRWRGIERNQRINSMQGTRFNSRTFYSFDPRTRAFMARNKPEISRRREMASAV